MLHARTRPAHCAPRDAMDKLCPPRPPTATLDMASCEPKRTSAYSEDLRWRVVYQRYGLERSYREIASNLNIDVSTVSRTIELFSSTGNVQKAQHPKGQHHPFQKLTDIDGLVIIEAVLERPGIYLHEIRQHLLEETGTDVSLSTICNFLHRNGFTRQKLTGVALERSDTLRAKYMEDVSIFSAEMFVFIDETGSDRRDSLRKYAYSLRGKPAKALQLFNRGRHITAIAAMSVEGVLECTMTEGGVTGDIFKKFLEEKLVTRLHPFNGSNPHSIIVMDNASIHKVEGVVELLEGLGLIVYFLPPYSPDYNPIEELFAKVKSILKANEHIMENFETLLLSAFSVVTPTDCKGWIRHAGYT